MRFEHAPSVSHGLLARRRNGPQRVVFLPSQPPLLQVVPPPPGFGCPASSLRAAAKISASTISPSTATGDAALPRTAAPPAPAEAAAAAAAAAKAHNEPAACRPADKPAAARGSQGSESSSSSCPGGAAEGLVAAGRGNLMHDWSAASPFTGSMRAEGINSAGERTPPSPGSLPDEADLFGAVMDPAGEVSSSASSVPLGWCWSCAGQAGAGCSDGTFFMRSCIGVAWWH